MHRPGSRVAGGSFRPGEHDGAAVAQSSKSDLCATMRMGSSSRKCARCIRNPTSASPGLCPPAALPFHCSKVCSRAAQAQRYTSRFQWDSREVSQAFVALEPLELLTQTVQERLWCPCSCLSFGQCLNCFLLVVRWKWFF